MIGAHPHPPLPAMERFKMVVIEKNAGSIPQSATEKSNLPASTNNIDETSKNVNNKPDLDLTTGKSVEASKGEEPSTNTDSKKKSVAACMRMDRLV